VVPALLRRNKVLTGPGKGEIEMHFRATLVGPITHVSINI
jgi:hypothetical protein